MSGRGVTRVRDISVPPRTVRSCLAAWSSTKVLRALSPGARVERSSTTPCNHTELPPPLAAVMWTSRAVPGRPISAELPGCPASTRVATKPVPDSRSMLPSATAVAWAGHGRPGSPVSARKCSAPRPWAGDDAAGAVAAAERPAVEMAAAETAADPAPTTPRNLRRSIDGIVRPLRCQCGVPRYGN